MQNLYFDDDLYKDKYRASTARLQGWDYGSNGLYYLTICTEHRLHYFGEIVSDQNSETQNVALLQPTIIGEVAHHNWLDIPSHFSFVELDEFVIMPNHVHGILFINKPDKTDWKLNTFGSQSQNLGSVMRGYKASVKTFATTNNIEFGWQPRYYDHVIRNEKEYLNISGYIADNAQQWLLNGDMWIISSNRRRNIFRLGEKCREYLHIPYAWPPYKRRLSKFINFVPRRKILRLYKKNARFC